MTRRRAAGRFAPAALLALLLCLGCVADELREAQAAREAYDVCVAEYGASHSTCEELLARSLEAQRRYEARARQQWGCNPAEPDCPPER